MAAAGLLQIKNFAWSNQERRWFNPFVPLTKAEHRSLYLNSQWLSVLGCRQNSHESGVQDWPLFPVKSYYMCFCVLLPAFKKKGGRKPPKLHTWDRIYGNLLWNSNHISLELLNWGYTPTTLISYEGSVYLFALFSHFGRSLDGFEPQCCRDCASPVAQAELAEEPPQDVLLSCIWSSYWSAWLRSNDPHVGEFWRPFWRSCNPCLWIRDLEIHRFPMKIKRLQADSEGSSTRSIPGETVGVGTWCSPYWDGDVDL